MSAIRGGLVAVAATLCGLLAAMFFFFTLVTFLIGDILSAILFAVLGAVAVGVCQRIGR